MVKIRTHQLYIQKCTKNMNLVFLQCNFNLISKKMSTQITQAASSLYDVRG